MSSGASDDFSIVNLEEQIGKWVGRRSAGPPQVAYEKLRRLAEGVRGTALTPFPGVYRFKTHAEANEWSRNHILRAAKG